MKNMSDLIAGKVPPQAVEIEAELLGEVIMFPEAMDVIVPVINADDFYKESHKKIYKAVWDLWNKSEKIDMLIVGDHLRKHGELDSIGGAHYIRQITEGVYHAGNIKSHAYIVKDRAVKRVFIELGSQLMADAYDDGSDIEDILSFIGDKIQGIIEGVYGGTEVSWREWLNRAVEDYYERKTKAQKNELTGIRTPLHKLTMMTGGWQGGDLIIIAGRPSMGKTSVAVQVMHMAAMQGEDIDCYTLEMTGLQMTHRVMSCDMEISTEDIRNGKLSEEQEKKMEERINELIKLKFTIDDRPGIGVDYIKAKSSARRRQGKCRMIVIDYLNLMEHGMENDDAGFGMITRKLKGLAKELGVPVILLCQLNRKTEGRKDKRPSLGDLRDSGRIEQDADIVIFLYRAGYYSGDKNDKTIEFIVAKHRNGKVGGVKSTHNETMSRVYDEDDYGQGEVVKKLDAKQDELPF